ncbi:MAG: YtxH domain-containing protein [Deltaproteobacteria bacterium]|nr:YtxH domain-containing protein [Deltaproteobacteria bacterium]
MTTTTKVLTAFLAGGAIGAGAALLFAPYSGVETRKKIKESVDEAGKRAGEKTAELRRSFTDRTEAVKAAYSAGKDAYCKTTERMAEEA